MNLRDFVFVVRAVGFSCLVLSLVVLLSCGAPDCPCDFPIPDGGEKSDGREEEADDWFEIHYTDCVEMCDAIGVWTTGCGHQQVRQDCVEWLWYLGTTPIRCDSARACYDALTDEKECLEEKEIGDQTDWNPWTFASGCPVAIP